MLCSHSEQDIERRDKCNRTIHDVATDDCKDLLENLSEWLPVWLQYDFADSCRFWGHVERSLIAPQRQMTTC